MTAFPITATSPATYGGALPVSSDIVVIGGGVIGVCTALYLAQDGHQVTLLEKGRIAGEQSSRNWGWIRQQGRDADELPIMIEAAARWKELAQQTNVDIGLRQGGVTYLTASAKKLRGFEEWMPVAEAHGVDTRMITGLEASEMFPGISQPVLGGISTASDLRAEPWLAVPALAGIATRAGATLIEGCAVRALDLSAGQVSGVITEMGTIKTSTVVLAGGAWSSLFLRNHGVELPQLSVRENVLATQPLPQITDGAASHDGVAFRRRLDGSYTLAPSGVAELYVGPDAFRAFSKYLPQLKRAPFDQVYLPSAPQGFPDAWRTPRRWASDEVSPFERMRVLDPKPNKRQLSRLLRGFAALFPGLPKPLARTSWAGMIDTMPDIVPVVDHCPELPGLTIATGMSGHGFGIGPGMGRVLAALVTGGETGHNLHRFRATRFDDGSPIILGP